LKKRNKRVIELIVTEADGLEVIFLNADDRKLVRRIFVFSQADTIGG
jgi:hypothetical protein